MGHGKLLSPYRPLHLKNVIVTHNIIKNLIYVRKFTTDNKCLIEFDPYRFFVKDLKLVNSSFDVTTLVIYIQYLLTLLPLMSSLLKVNLSCINIRVTLAIMFLRYLVLDNFILCHKDKSPIIWCACQLGKQNKLPFYRSKGLFGWTEWNDKRME